MLCENNIIIICITKHPQQSLLAYYRKINRFSRWIKYVSICWCKILHTPIYVISSKDNYLYRYQFME